MLTYNSISSDDKLQDNNEEMSLNNDEDDTDFSITSSKKSKEFVNQCFLIHVINESIYSDLYEFILLFMLSTSTLTSDIR